MEKHDNPKKLKALYLTMTEHQKQLDAHNLALNWQDIYNETQKMKIQRLQTQHDNFETNLLHSVRRMMVNEVEAANKKLYEVITNYIHTGIVMFDEKNTEQCEDDDEDDNNEEPPQKKHKVEFKKIPTRYKPRHK